MSELSEVSQDSVGRLSTIFEVDSSEDGERSNWRHCAERWASRSQESMRQLSQALKSTEPVANRETLFSVLSSHAFDQCVTGTPAGFRGMGWMVTACRGKVLHVSFHSWWRHSPKEASSCW